MKSLLRSPFISRMLGYVIWAWMALVGHTVRWKVEGTKAAQEAWNGERGILVAAWHEQILLLPSGWTQVLRQWTPRPGGVSMLVSLSRDAEPVAKALDHLGINTIRGSKGNSKKKDKDKGGVKAIAEAIRLLRSTGSLCVTPDGPRGPARHVSDGSLVLAQRSGARVLTYALCVSSRARLKSWDRMILPWLFGRGAIVFGEPIDATELSLEGFRQALQSSLDNANARAEAMVFPGDAPAKRARDAA
ncbi:MAG: DUF374 domain-containing protein [Pseudomonadota bacterium]